MWEDPIVEEVHKARDAHAAKFNYNLQAIYRDLKEQEKQSGRTFVSYPPQAHSRGREGSHSARVVTRAEQGPGADWEQRPLVPRSRCSQQLRPSVRCFGKAKTLYQQSGKLL